MKLIGVLGTAVLSLTIAAPAYAQQEQHDQEEHKDERAKPEEKKAQPEKPAGQEERRAQGEKNNKPEEKNAQRRPQESNREEGKPGRPEQHVAGGRIPEDRFKANFGREHSFRVSEGDYRNHRFQYGGYWFGFADPWPSNWLYSQDVFVVEIGGVYYLCNASFPGVNVALSIGM
jgi:hypothetical protein